MYLVLELFITALKTNSAFIGRVMLEELATAGAEMLVDVLNKRKVYLGSTKDGDVDYIEANFEEEDIRVIVEKKRTLNFYLSIFPQDIAFNEMPETDVLINNWDNIVEDIDDGNDIDELTSFLTFSGTNPMAEKAMRMFIKMGDDASEYPTLGVSIGSLNDSIMAIREFCMEYKIKLLVHSTDNVMYLSVYSPEYVKEHEEDLAVYLEEESYPFGTLLSIINVNISMLDRQDGVIDNSFRKGNINSTYELLTRRLKVAPSMKAVVDDSARRKLVKDEKVLNDVGYVTAPTGIRRLPNVVDFVYIPAAILGSASKLLNFKEELPAKELVLAQKGFPEYLARHIMKEAKSGFATNRDMKYLLECNREQWEKDSMAYNLENMFNQKNMAYTTNGVAIFVDSWKKVVKRAQLVSTNDEILLYSLAHQLGWDSFNKEYQRFPFWMERMDDSDEGRYKLAFDAENEDAKFLEGLFKLIKGLNSSDYSDGDNAARIEDYIDNYDVGASYNLSSGTKFKSKTLATLAEIVQTAYTVSTDGADEKKGKEGSLTDEVLK